MLEQEIKNNIRSIKHNTIEGWRIEYSIVHNHILMFFVSLTTLHTITRYFDNEEKAVEYAKLIISLDPTIQQPTRF
jgi:hypothetical protein